MKYLIFFSFSILSIMSSAQGKYELDRRIQSMTTIVHSSLMDQMSQGSGFFYFESDIKTKDNFRKINNMWLITNKHVVLFRDIQNNYHLPSNLTFNLRSFVNDSLVWNPISISKTDLQKRTKVSENPFVDVVAINVTDLIEDRLINDKTIVNLITGVSEEMTPERDSTVSPQVSEDIIVVGYPSEFYDRKALFPIVKSGIIASKWGAYFNGNPYFLVDSKLFPGSSGSLVLTKPSNFLIKNGHFFTNSVKQMTFMGIYSGDPVKINVDASVEKFQKFDLGIVWYPSVIIDIIKNGINLNMK